MVRRHRGISSFAPVSRHRKAFLGCGELAATQVSGGHDAKRNKESRDRYARIALDQQCLSRRVGESKTIQGGEPDDSRVSCGICSKALSVVVYG